MKHGMKRTLSVPMALLLALLLPVAAFAEEYDLVNGSITVTADAGGQSVSQNGGAPVLQNSETVIRQTGGSTGNTVKITAASNSTAEVTLDGVDISASGAAVSTGGAGSVAIELDGDNYLQSGNNHAGLEKNNTGTLTIGDADGNGSLAATGGFEGAGIGARGWNGDGSGITITGGTVTATGGMLGAGIGGGYLIDGRDITITGGTVTATGGFGGAGIGGGDGGDVTVSGAAQVRAQGGVALQGGTGAGIGSGGARGSVDGAEIVPDTGRLTPNGWIEYYAPGADMNTTDPTQVIIGRYRPAPRAYGVGDRVNVNGRVWVIAGIEGDALTLVSADAFTEEQLRDLEALIQTLLTEAQLAKLLADETTGARAALADEATAKTYFGGEAGHIMIRAERGILG